MNTMISQELVWTVLTLPDGRRDQSAGNWTVEKESSCHNRPENCLIRSYHDGQRIDLLNFIKVDRELTY